MLNPSRAVLSDANADLMEFYAVLRGDPAALWRDVVSLPRTRPKYLELRSCRRSRMSRHERAVQFLFLNRNCFNGLYRTDRTGRFNVPFASSRAGALPSLAEFLDASAQLRRARLRACDFGHSLRTARSGDFVYMDPPYFVTARRMFRGYGPRDFLQKDIDRLARHLDRLDARGARFVLSFADCGEIRPIAACWTNRRVRVRRHIAGFTGDRRYAYELLISNADAN